MSETQQSIIQWSAETFGEVSSNLRIAIRAAEEMSELLKEISTGQGSLECMTEAADVAIVLYRLCEQLGVKINTSIIRRQDPDNPVILAAEANRQMASLIVMLCYDDNNELASYALQQIFYLLEKFCESFGGNLHVRIDAKMQINRAREWRKDASGHDYHIKT